MARPTRSGKDQKKKRSDLFRRIANRLKIRKLQEINKRGKATSTKKKGLSNIPVKERSATINKKAKGLSNLGAGYKAAEKKLATTATQDSAKRNKAKYPKMGTYKSSGTKSKSTETKKKSETKTSSEYIKYKGKLISKRTAQGRNAANKLKAKKRAQEMAKKRKKK